MHNILSFLFLSFTLMKNFVINKNNRYRVIMQHTPALTDTKSKKNKSKMSKFFIKNTEYKKQIRESFEGQFADNAEFDAYIDSQFKKMNQEKNQNPMLIIPSGFLKFVQSKSFKELLKRTYIYMESLLQFENKYESLIKQQEHNNNLIDDPLFKMLRLQTDILEQKCKQISYAYMGILLGYGDNKLVFKDQYFFETMIYFLTQILHGNFESVQYLKVEEELNRIFRTNTFNLIKRRHEEDQMIKRFPALKESKYDGSEASEQKLLARLSLQKKNNYSMQIRSPKDRSIQKPINIPLSTFHSIRSRSPLIASFYPSEKEKLFHFSKQVRQKQSFFKSSRGNPESSEQLNLSSYPSARNRSRQSFMIKKRRNRYSGVDGLGSQTFSMQLNFLNLQKE